MDAIRQEWTGPICSIICATTSSIFIPVVKLIDQFQETLEKIKIMIEQDQADALQETFANANLNRGKLVESNT